MAGLSNDAQHEYLEYVDSKYVPLNERVIVEQHRPRKFVVPYHHHASIEVNFFTNCEMEYSFSGQSIAAPDERMVVFWGAVPHCVKNVKGDGNTVNIYIAFSQMLNWNLPDNFVDALIGGDIVCATSPEPVDALTFPRWANEYTDADQALNQVIIGEIEMRLRRMATTGWETLRGGEGYVGDLDGRGSAMRYIEQMLRFISTHYGSPISVMDVTEHVCLSQSYAMTLFRRVVGVPIKEHITRTRLSHAQMLLSNSEEKIVNIAMDSGFGSLSSFYEAFQARAKKTPAAFRRETRH